LPAPVEHALTRDVTPASPAGDRAAEIYDRHAAAVYQQALLILGDESLAGQVARDVIVAECIVAECTVPAVSPDDADRVSGRLAASALWRCQELMAGQGWQDSASRRDAAQDRSGSQDSEGRERRALLGLVLFGGMGYREAARELEISPSRAAESLRAALITQADSPAHALLDAASPSPAAAAQAGFRQARSGV
jgi:hypothetical protein